MAWLAGDTSSMMQRSRSGAVTGVAPLLQGAAGAPGNRNRSSRRGAVLSALLACALALLAEVSLAHATGPSALVVYGKADKRLQGIVFGEVERVLREATWQLSAPFDDAESQVVSGCMDKPTPWKCMRFVVNRKGVDRVIGVRVDVEAVSSTQTQVVLTGQLVLAETSSKIEQSRYCAACSDDEVRSYAAQIAKQLLDERAVLAGTTRIQVKSEPIGAEVLIDGKVVGITNNAFATSPGEHTLEVRMKGYDTVLRPVTAVDGKTVATAVTLNRPEVRVSLPPGGEEGGNSSGGVLPKVMVGVGAAAIVAGGVLVFFDGEEQPDNPMKRTYYDTTPFTIGLAAGGVLLSAVGAYLWLRAPAKTESRSVKAATFMPTTGGFSVGLAGSF